MHTREVVNTHDRHRARHVEIRNTRVQIVTRQVRRLPRRVVVMRHVGVAWSKRHPTNLVLLERNERDERRRVDRLDVHTIRHPVPAIADEGPTPIVIRRVAPRLTRNPRWTIRIIGVPVTTLIRRPTRIDARRPTIAITLDVAPVAVVIEIIEAGYV